MQILGAAGSALEDPQNQPYPKSQSSGIHCVVTQMLSPNERFVALVNRT